PAPTGTRWAPTTTRCSDRRWCSSATARPVRWSAARRSTTSSATRSCEAAPGLAHLRLPALLRPAGRRPRAHAPLVRAARAEQGLGADVVVAEAKGLAEGELEHLLGRLVVGDRRGRPLDPGGERHGAPHPLGVSAEVGEDPGRDGV